VFFHGLYSIKKIVVGCYNLLMGKSPVKKSLILLLLFLLLPVGVIFSMFHLSKLLSPAPTNLIIISVDTLRADHMGVYGYTRNTTPSIDTFSKKATVFTNAYTQVPITYSSFVSLMTGLTPFESNIFSNMDSVWLDEPNKFLPQGNAPLGENVQTLAEILKDRGYMTSAFLLNPVLREDLTNLDQGFDEYRIHDQLNNPSFIKSTMQDIADWFDKKPYEKSPVFLWVHFLDPHTPYLPEPETACNVNKMFCNDNAAEAIATINKKVHFLEGCQNEPLDADFIQANIDLYDAEITQTDVYIGELLRKIEKAGLMKNSLIIFYGDHGESFENNYNFHHGLTLYESSVKIPLIIYTPDNPKKNAEGFVKSADVFATITNLLGVQTGTGKGNNFSHVLRDDSLASKAQNSSLFFMNNEATKFAVREGKYKYIFSLDSDRCSNNGKRELYDISTDPGEKKNLVGEQKNLAAKLHSILITYLDDHQLDIKNQQTSSELKEVLTDKKKQKIIEELKSLGY
jgi:arylsulfatase A-like enzyme